MLCRFPAACGKQANNARGTVGGGERCTDCGLISEIYSSVVTIIKIPTFTEILRREILRVGDFLNA